MKRPDGTRWSEPPKVAVPGVTVEQVFGQGEPPQYKRTEKP